ncbi:hypothetical protein SLS58_006692 [Diplodia intermedia]|uniref:Uncharacterized protein n=1 Tax=Diplodia intermedia TaxID=856260 RepID=A0ABR3TMD9_9PEZI
MVVSSKDDGVFYFSNWKCFALLESPLAQAMISIECLEITLLFLISLFWLLKQRKIQPPYRVVALHNFGVTLSFWIIYAIYRSIIWLITWCPFTDDHRIALRCEIAETVFHWLAASSLLATVLQPLCRGLDRLGDDTPSSRWAPVSRILLASLTVLIISYIAVLTYEHETFIRTAGAISTHRHRDMAKAAELLWLLLAFAGAIKMAVALRRASAAATAAAVRVIPGALRGWTYALAFSLFAYGFVRAFVAFWNPPAMVFVFDRAGYLAENVPVLVLPVAFELLALLAVVEVAQGLGGVLRHPEASQHESLHVSHPALGQILRHTSQYTI